MTKQTGNGCAIGGILTAVIAVFVAGGPLGIATLVLGILALNGDAWAKTLGVIEIIIGVIFIIIMALYMSMA